MDLKSIIFLILLVLAMIAVLILAYWLLVRGIFKKDKNEEI